MTLKYSIDKDLQHDTTFLRKLGQENVSKYRNTENAPIFTAVLNIYVVRNQVAKDDRELISLPTRTRNM